MKKILCFIAFLTMSLSVFAQASMKVQAPNLVGINEQFNVTFIISGENAPSDFQWEVGNDFQLVWGPQKGSSTSVSIMNGTRTRSSQTTYTYILLPKATGRFQLAAASATVKGEKLSTGPHSIEVVTDGASSSSSQGSQGQSQSQSSRQSASSEVSNEDIFLRLSLSKTNAMVGETISATLKLYQRVNIAGFEDAKFPTFNGFWSQEVQAPTNIEFHRESIGEKIYNAAVLRSWSLVPQKAGDIRIDGSELVCLVNVRSPRASTGSIFDSFFQDDYQTIRKRVSTNPITVHVSGLPAGAPASFGGGVGNFKMSAALTHDTLKAHDAASLKVTVTGSGNVSLLEAPKVDFPPDFELYDVKTSDISGGKVFEFPFIPRSHGEFIIGPVEYSYLDINTRKYVTLTSQPLEITVEKGSASQSDNSGQLVSGVSKKDVRDLGSDIRFISTKTPDLSRSASFFVGSAAFVILVALLIVASVAVWFGFKRMEARRADVAGNKNRGATKMARKRLAQAGTFLKSDLYTAFYEELHKALLGFVSDKLNMDAADMSKENISARLLESGVSEKAASELVSLIDACEFARYSPASGHDAMNAHYENAVSVISTIDATMKKGHRSAATGTAAVMAALLMLCPSHAKAQTQYADSLWTKGVNAYTESQWESAVSSWESIASLGISSKELQYNLGNAYFKSGDLAHAILSYERALKLDPSYADARYNLEFAQSMTQDNIEAVPEFFLKTALRKVSWMLSSDSWTVLSLVLFALFLAMALIFVLGSGVSAKKAGFIGGIAAIILSLVCMGNAFWQKSDYYRSDSAVVTKAVSSVRSSPGSESAKDLFVLHEGTKVKLLDEVGNWRNIELADGRQGWIPASDVEVI